MLKTMFVFGNYFIKRTSPPIPMQSYATHYFNTPEIPSVPSPVQSKSHHPASHLITQITHLAFLSFWYCTYTITHARTHAHTHAKKGIYAIYNLAHRLRTREASGGRPFRNPVTSYVSPGPVPQSREVRMRKEKGRERDHAAPIALTLKCRAGPPHFTPLHLAPLHSSVLCLAVPCRLLIRRHHHRQSQLSQWHLDL